MARLSWFGRAVRNEHHHAIEQASRRWRRGRRDDSARTHRNILISTQEMTPPSSSRGVGGAERVRRNCCRPRRARQWKHRTAFARLRGVQQQRRSTGAGRGRSSSSSIGSMFEPRSRSRRGDRFMVYVQCDICAVRVDHGASGNLIYRLSGAPNAANASEASRADSCSRLQRSGGSLRAATA